MEGKFDGAARLHNHVHRVLDYRRHRKCLLLHVAGVRVSPSLSVYYQVVTCRVVFGDTYGVCVRKGASAGALHSLTAAAYVLLGA
jgi:hypothetical protein